MAKKATKPTDENKVIEQTTEHLLTMLQVDGDFDFTFENDEVLITMETQDTGLVIGYHGEVLESLQKVLSLCLTKQLGRFIRVSVEVGDYRKNRSEWVENLAARAKERALEEQREVPLTNLKSWERRIVHMLLQEDKEVMTESVGEGNNRTLVVKPRA